MTSNNDFEKLIENLPFFLQENLKKHPHHDHLIEIILDLGRRPEARFSFGPEYLSQKIISWQDIDYVTKRLSKFSNENRAGIERTLHRVSCIRNRQFLINGLTCRIGRSIFGTVSVIRDLLESDKSILILGKPGVGKTTIIREIGRVLADELEKRVIIIDTSNEIAGDSDIPHFGIGRARRMQVPKTELQHQIMIEAVENHMPQVIIIDEIGTELEVLAAQTIAEKGVQLVGTTHGNCLENLIKNPPLSNLIGGIQYVTLSDEEAKRRGTQKSILERKASPAFEIIIEINDTNFWTIHEDAATSTDSFLRGDFLPYQTRQFIGIEKTKIQCNQGSPSSNSFVQTFNRPIHTQFPLMQRWTKFNNLKMNWQVEESTKILMVYSYSISVNFLKESFFKLGIKCIVTNDLQKASLIIGSKGHLHQNARLQEFANRKNIPVYALNELNLYKLTELIKLLLVTIGTDNESPLNN
jgi:stage III sporulation protein SpoIIIAA